MVPSNQSPTESPPQCIIQVSRSRWGPEGYRSYSFLLSLGDVKLRARIYSSKHERKRNSFPAGRDKPIKPSSRTPIDPIREHVTRLKLALDKSESHLDRMSFEHDWPRGLIELYVNVPSQWRQETRTTGKTQAQHSPGIIPRHLNACPMALAIIEGLSVVFVQ